MFVKCSVESAVMFQKLLVGLLLLASVSYALGDNSAQTDDFDSRYAQYKLQVQAYLEWQQYFADYQNYLLQRDVACGCLCNATNSLGQRLQYATCCSPNPPIGCSNDPAKVCADLTICKSGEFESITPNSTRNRECTPYSVCSPSESYESKEPTSTSDRKCTPLSICSSSQYEVNRPASGNYFADRVCRNLTVCNSTQFQLTPATATSDRACKEYTQCDYTTQYQAGIASHTADRVCKPLTVCKPSEYQSRRPTPLSDRVCKTITVCDPATSYESKAPTATSDRQCSPIQNLNP